MIYVLLYCDHGECDVVFFVRRLNRKWSFNSDGNGSRGQGPKTGRLGVEMEGRNWPPSLHKPAQP
jgi:hypothetical protein